MRLERFLLLLVFAGLTLGAAHAGEPEPDPRDPWEGFNRAVFSFNDGLDSYILKPTAQGYRKVTPQPTRVWVANFFGNINDVWVGFNNLLQGKPGDAASDLGRVAINSTVGILGTFDIATELGLEKHDEDFGQTLATWGTPDGPYLVLPVFGPRTARDGSALVMDTLVDPVGYVNPATARYSATGLRVISRREQLLGAEGALETAALDKYSFTRDFYLKRRRYEIHDGAPPREKEEEE